jgi:Na+-translocating ferredoxin:NAD+ oxidoreductase RnfC subunit
MRFGQVTDPATPAQRQRMEWLGEQLHAIGLAIQQAQARGDTAAVTTLRAMANKLNAERMALMKTINTQGAQQQQAAESGALASPLERVAASVRKYALIGGLLIGAAIIVPPLLRRGR